MTSPGQNLIAALEIWAKALEDYSYAGIIAKPSPEGWSIGQVYVHLITNTRFFVEQAALCLQSHENSAESYLPQAAKMFANNSFPDLRLEGPASNADTIQPLNKDELKKGLEDVKRVAAEIVNLESTNDSVGKTRHPGLGFFNAREWLQFAEMHLRHHLRQKQRIDRFLHEHTDIYR